MTKREFEEELNELGAPEDDREENGGRVPTGAEYGAWLRRNDPIAFEVAYNERERG